MIKFFYALLLICNTATNVCKVERHFIDEATTYTYCTQYLEEELDKAYHYKDTTTEGFCVEFKLKDKEI